MSDPTECAAFNVGCCRWVRKCVPATETVAGGSPEHIVVYGLGPLCCEWPGRTAFERNRFVDRHIVRGGDAVPMDIWNGSAKWLLDRLGSHTGQGAA